jgi:REP element-mobilizing transposase RayT
VLRQLLQTTWLDLPLHYPSIHLEGLVIMPDHIHCIIWINKWPERLQGKSAPYLWQVMQSYKSKVAIAWLAYVKENHPDQSAKIWQRRYFDRILRIGELETARLYIRANPDNETADWKSFYTHMGWKPLS